MKPIMPRQTATSPDSDFDHNPGGSPLPGRMAAIALLLLILFVGVIPLFMEVRSMPTGARALPQRDLKPASWPIWPAVLKTAAGVPAARPWQKAYSQLAAFANRSAHPMAVVERTIGDVKAGRATSNDLYLASRAAGAAAADERDALMGLILPPEMRSSANLQAAWHAAQLASLAKIAALEALENPTGSGKAWDQPAYTRALATVREETATALARMQAAASDPVPAPATGAPGASPLSGTPAMSLAARERVGLHHADRDLGKLRPAAS
jgi:hypothetical protein